jgi:putative membrane protein
MLPLLAALLGTLLAALLALIPALHVYNVAGLILLVAIANPSIDPQVVALFMLGLVVGYAMLNTLPAILLSAPDDSMIFAVLPAQKYLLNGRGYEAVLLTGLGSLGGLVVLLALSPFLGLILAPVRVLVQPHLHWILGLIIVYMILSEWPWTTGTTPVQKFVNAWSQLLAGLVTFTLSGLLGFVLMYRSPVPIEAAYQNLLPAFVGFFALPAVLQQLVAGSRPPQQHLPSTLDVTPDLLARGIGAGSLGGLFAAFFPVVTGGIGGFLAGHATAQRDDRVFLISQGANKMLYYVGAYLFFFVPGLRLTRGGMAAMVSTFYTAASPDTYWLVIAALAFSGLLAFFLMLGLTQFLIRIIPRLDHRLVAFVTLVLLITVVIAVTGLSGLAVSLVAAAIGLIPLFWRTRRMHCLGVLLLPVTLNMAGLGGIVAHWLKLI